MKSPFRNRSVRALRLAALAALWHAGSPITTAANYYWDIDGATAGAGGATPSGTWSTGGTNWSTGSTGSTATSAYTTAASDDLYFSAGSTATGAYTINLTSTVNAKSLSFQDGSATISGAGGNIALAGTGIVNVGSGLTATIGENTDTIISGTNGLTKTGTGTLLLNGTAASTFTGGITISGGTLTLDFTNQGANNNIVASANTLTLNGGTLSVKANAGNDTSQTFNGVTVGAGGGVINFDPVTFTRTLNLGALTATAAGGSLQFTQGTGIGNITTSNSNNSTGILSARLVNGSGGATTPNWASVSGGIIGDYASYSALNLTVGTDTLNSRITASQSLSGSRTTNTLKIENPAASQTLALGANTLTLASGGLLSTGTNAFSITGTTGATRLTAGNGSGTYDLIVHQFNTGGLTISAVIGNNGANAVNLVKAGPETLILSGTNTYTGTTYVNAGTLQANTLTASTNTLGNSAASIRSGATLLLNNTITTGTATTVSNTFTGTGLLKLRFADGGSVRNTFLPNVTGFNGTIQLSKGTNPTADKWNVGSGMNAPGATVIVDSGTTMILGYSATFAGVILNGAGNSEGLGAIRIVGSSIVLTGDISLASSSNINIEYADASTRIASNITSGAAGTQTLTLGGTGGTVTGNIGGGTGTIALALGATYTLTGTNTYTGDTSIGAGTTLLIGSAGSLGSGNYAGAIGNAHRLRYGSTANQILSGNITGAGAVVKETSTASTLALSGTNNYNGGTSVTHGGLTFLNTGAKPSSGTHAFSAGTTLGLGVASSGSFFTSTDITNAFAGSMSGNLSGITVTATTHVGIDTTAGNFTYAGSVAGSPAKGLTKLGNNTLTLTGVNTYSGATTVSQGTLQLGEGTAAGALSTSSAISMASGATFAINQSDTVTQGTDFGSAAITGAGGFTQAGGGTTVLNTTNSYTGPTNVNAGTLSINGNQSSATGAVTVAMGATLGGTGTIGGDTTIQNGGNVAPGSGPGTLNFGTNSDLAFNNGSKFQWEITTASNTYDRVIGTTGGTLGGSGAAFNITSSSAYTDAFWDTSRTWTNIFTGFASGTSNWTSIFSSITGAGLTWANGKASVPGGTRGYFTVSGSTLSWTAVPEPTSALGGLLLTAGLLRRRRKPAEE